jgi:hypothetical protein
MHVFTINNIVRVELQLFGVFQPGGFTLCQVEHHVQTKFARYPILHAIDIFKNYDIFPTYTYPLILSFVYIFEISSHLHFCSIYFSSILRHSS